ncbi:MAG: SLC13 family permease [Methanobacteriota archaeon]
MASWLGVAIFVAAYVAIMVRRLPFLRHRIARPWAAVAGGAAMVVAGVVAPRDALSAIDLDVLALLLGMMALVSGLEVAGFFRWAAREVVRRSHDQRRLLLYTCGLTALLSALVLNDAVVLLFTPILVKACDRMKVSPMPHLAAVAIAANVGSVATQVGNPQNAYIALLSGIPFLRFSAVLAPIALLCLLVAYGMLRWGFRAELARPIARDVLLRDEAPVSDPRLFRFVMAATGITVLVFFASGFVAVELPVIALAGGALVVFGASALGHRPSAILRRVDYGVLVFFVGLFVLIRGASEAGLLRALEPYFLPPGEVGIAAVAVWASVLSNLVSNVPAVILLSSTVGATGAEPLWLVLAAASTLAGNATFLGSAATVIVAETARAHGAEFDVWKFTKVGLPIAVVTVALATALLWGMSSAI